MDKNWKQILEKELSSSYMGELFSFLAKERSEYTIYPSEDLVFSAFFETPFDKVKVVIIGQDPYHGNGQAHGLSFSVLPGVSPPPSLKNIFKELSSDLHLLIPKTGYLLPWAKQGVFLLNSILTVRAGEPKSHHNQGWERFTDAVIDKLLQREDPLVFLLWGKSAEEKGARILRSQTHKVLIAAHPSPYSAKNFLGCRHFSKANEYLVSWGKEPVTWDLP